MFTHVDRPIYLGPVELKNRIARTAHGTNFGLNEGHIEYHLARARGGVALTVLEVGSVHPSTRYMFNLYEPATMDWLRQLVAAVQPHGMRLIQQLYHGGHQAFPADGSPPWAPSDIPSVEAGIVPIAMTKDMVGEIVASYAHFARRCEEIGLDGVEIHCAHGKLPQQFLSPGINQRDDEYGGSLENRARFIFEVLEAVRAAVSRNFAVGARLSPDLQVNGADVDDNIWVARQLEQRGLIDYLSLGQGNFTNYAKMLGGMHEPTGYQLDTNEPISRAVSIPTMIAGRYRTLEEADQAIRAGEADVVGMVRAMIADPHLVAKSFDGRAEQVRPCIGCNQGCVGNVSAMGGMRCTVNPGVGAEGILGDDSIKPAPYPKSVLVVGGGPAGMEAARVSALRGHRVILAEATPKLGGTLRAAAKAPTRAGIFDVADWLEREIYRLGVDVRLATPVDVDDVNELAVDSVIVATGAWPRSDGVLALNPGVPIANLESARMISSRELFLDSPAELGKHAVVIDDVGHYEALAAAEQLVALGLNVTLVTRHKALAYRLQTAQMIEPFLTRMAGKPFQYRIRTRAIAVENGELVVGPAHLQTNQDSVGIRADTIVFISADRPERGLYDELRIGNIPTLIVGDANSPRFLENAIREGHVAGATV